MIKYNRIWRLYTPILILWMAASMKSFSEEVKNEKVDSNNCYAIGLEKPRYCKIVEGDPEKYSWKWFLSEYDKYGTELEIANAIGGKLIDGKLTRDEVFQIVDALGKIYGIGPIASALGFGPKAPTMEETLAKFFADLEKKMYESEGRIIKAIYGVAIEQANAEEIAFQNGLHSWSLMADLQEKISAYNTGELAELIFRGSELWGDRIANYNEGEHLDRLHGTIQIASTLIQLETEKIRLNKLNTYPELAYAYDDLPLNLKSNYTRQAFDDLVSVNDADLQRDVLLKWKKHVDNVITYLEKLDLDEEWKSEVNSWFTDPKSYKVYDDIAGSHYRYSEYMRLLSLADSICDESVMKRENTDRNSKWIEYYVYLNRYEVNGAVHSIRKVNATCRYKIKGRIASRDLGRVYSDDFGNIFDSLDQALEWHKKLEYERFLKSVYAPVKAIVDEWSQSLEAEGFVVTRPKLAVDVDLENPKSIIWDHYLLDSKYDLNSPATYLGHNIEPGVIYAFKLSNISGSIKVNLTGSDIGKLKLKTINDCFDISKENLNERLFPHTTYFSEGSSLTYNLNEGGEECFAVVIKEGNVNPVTFGLEVIVKGVLSSDVVDISSSDFIHDKGIVQTSSYGGYGSDRVHVLDVNGDSKKDILIGPSKSGTWSLMESNGGYLVDYGNILLSAYGSWYDNANRIRTMDVTGDGRDDVVIGPESNGNWYVLKSVENSDGTSGLESEGLWADAYGGWYDNTNRIWESDFTGDGKADIVIGPESNGNWYLLESDGTQFINKGKRLDAYGSWHDHSERIHVLDIDGDGKKNDFLIGPSSKGNWYWVEVRGSNFIDHGNVNIGSMYSGWGGDSMGKRVRAMNVDGKVGDEIVIGPRSTGEWYVLKLNVLSKSLEDWGVWADAYGSWYDNTSRINVADINNDGLDDIVIGPESTGSWYWLESTGAKFVPGTLISNKYGTWYDNSGDINVGDFTGGGSADVLIGPRSDGVWFMMEGNK